jgi:SHAQKYF class myb-like DNA-binding protein
LSFFKRVFKTFFRAENTFIQPEYANAAIICQPNQTLFPEFSQQSQDVKSYISNFSESIRDSSWAFSSNMDSKSKTIKRKKSSKESFSNGDDPSISPSKRSRRNWTEEEEARFLEALELFGRDWHKCAEYMGTRDVVSCRSHAQKIFIKLWISGEPLPQKVAQQGAGYTVSGKPLDPDSSFVKYYISLFDKKRTSEAVV